MESTKPALEMKRISKEFPGVLANDCIDFNLNPGEIHALLGENGAGKTTLMNILYGICQADGGEIWIRGKKVTIRSPKDAITLGIGMVHQHFKLAYPLTVLENAVLGSPVPFFSPLREAEKKIRGLAEKYNLQIKLQAEIRQLSARERQRVEIIKALYPGASILILDEPTSVLTDREITDFFTVLQNMVKKNCAIVIITHKLAEVMRLSNRVTVLRLGKVVQSFETRKTNQKELARAMVGRDVISRLVRPQAKKGKTLLNIRDLCAYNDKGLPCLKNISFAIHEGEIFGIAGVAGNGQRELVEVITGMRRATGGKIVISGKEMTNCRTRKIVESGVAHIPEERMDMGIVPNMSVAENFILTHQPIGPKFLDYKRITQNAEQLISDYNIAAPSVQTPVRLLSGGNIQKLIVAREISAEPRLLLASHPTYGLDVSATEQIRRLLLKQREKQTAILLVSEDLEEIMMLSDRIAVIYEGEIMEIVDAEQAKSEKLGLMMGGIKP